MSTATATQVDGAQTTQDGLSLQYNQPLTVPENFSANCAVTTQANSVLQIENLSTSNTLSYFINGGSALTQAGSIRANTSTPFQAVVNFNGARLVVTNTSSRDASALVTLKST